MTKLKTTAKEKMIVNLMEEVISILSTCKDLSDPEFSMYEVMKDAVDKEVYYPLYDQSMDIVTVVLVSHSFTIQPYYPLLLKST